MAIQQRVKVIRWCMVHGWRLEGGWQGGEQSMEMMVRHEKDQKGSEGRFGYGTRSINAIKKEDGHDGGLPKDGDEAEDVDLCRRGEEENINIKAGLCCFRESQKKDTEKPRKTIKYEKKKGKGGVWRQQAPQLLPQKAHKVSNCLKRDKKKKKIFQRSVSLFKQEREVETTFS